MARPAVTGLVSRPTGTTRDNAAREVTQVAVNELRASPIAARVDDVVRAAGAPHRRVVGLVLVVCAIVAPACWLALLRGTGLADGSLTFSASPLWSSAGVGVMEVSGQPGDLRVGDRVVAVAGVPLETWVSDRPDRVFHVGEHVIYDVVRDGVEVPAEVTLVRYPFGAKVAAHLSMLVLMVLLLAVGAFVFLKRPTDRAARTLFGISVLAPLTMTTWPMGVQVIDLANGPRLWPHTLGDVATAVLWSAMLYLMIVLPQPRGVFARYRSARVAAFVLPYLLYGGYLAVNLPHAPDALGRLARLHSISVTSAVVFPFLILAAITWQYVAESDPVARRRIRWVLATMGITVGLYAALGQIPDRLLGHPLVSWDWIPLFYAGFPVVLGAAVLRYRLFDIQIIFRRSLLFAALTLMLAGIYLGIVTVLGGLSSNATDLGPVLATAAVAISFQPLRILLRRMLSRLVFGDRDDPYRVLSRLALRLEATTSADSVLDATVATLAQTLRLSYAAVEVVTGDSPTASVGEPGGNPVRVPLLHCGEHVGDLVLDAGPAREPFGPTDQELLSSLARQIAVIAHNDQLNRRLQRSLGQLVTAREEERRRLRRDIHDGLGPLLAAGSMHLAVARRVLHKDPDRAETILDTLADNQKSLLADVRRLVDQLRPPVLDQLGLVAALRQRSIELSADGQLDVILDTEDDLRGLPAAVEVAALHIVGESVTNVIRHAAAHHCVIRLRRDGGLRIEVHDDGRGLPRTYRAGIGLDSIRERAAQLGGTATITADPRGGTTVRAYLPTNLAL